MDRRKFIKSAGLATAATAATAIAAPAIALTGEDAELISLGKRWLAMRPTIDRLFKTVEVAAARTDVFASLARVVQS